MPEQKRLTLLGSQFSTHALCFVTGSLSDGRRPVDFHMAQPNVPDMASIALKSH
jgi:hypothetical protein